MQFPENMQNESEITAMLYIVTKHVDTSALSEWLAWGFPLQLQHTFSISNAWETHKHIVEFR